jgi:SAM-dependent methyltransferase
MMPTPDDPGPMPSAMPRHARRWLPLARRSSARERLDAGGLPRGELETNLADLARLNILPGGRRASANAIERLAGRRQPLTVLDVGTGHGDMPLVFGRRGWEVVGLDADPDVAEVARATVDGAAGIRIVEGDARALPFADRAFDVAHCSLLMHHLDPKPAITALRELARVSRLGVVVNDLRRGLLPLIATATAVTVLGRCRTTRHDGVVSVLRAYRTRELDELLVAAGLRVVDRTPPWMPRVVTSAVSERR